MTRAILILSLLLPLLAGAAVPGAAASEMSLYLRNQAGRAVVLELRSRARDQRWPGDDEVYMLERGEKKMVPIECNEGERICYGGWVYGNDREAFGIGPDDDRTCETCCRICVNKTIETIDIGP